MKQSFDVLVVGAGHAGLEAAHAAARIGATVAIVSMREADIGTLSCNPAIGGVGKGHLVREIDAFDGVMGRWADAAGIQFRLLNASKGPAVRGPRTQIDRDAYRTIARREMLADPGIQFVRGEVVDLLVVDGAARGVVLADGAEVGARATIITTGTFLGGMIHIGHETTPAGRAGDPAANRLSARLLHHGLALGRLKTGTPPRLLRETIAWDRIDRQLADDDPTFLSLETAGPALDQVACGVTTTNLETHDIIRGALGQSALYGGQLSGKGPRYCPSVEDKVVRFADRESHTVFLEPEGHGSNLVYPNGISTSLPADVQTAMVRSIRGLEDARIVRPGYAIEYDYADPRSLGSDLQFEGIRSLYLAGQINGTTGYEEAAIQGLVAGANAALQIDGRGPLPLDRTSSYAGVLIDDLTTAGVTEPYRMFTSRAEFRLNLRCDNAELRLGDLGRRLGLVSEAKWAAICERRKVIAAMRAGAEETGSPTDLRHARITLDAEALYAPYLARQERDATRLREDAAVEFRGGMSFDLPGLTVQQRERLNAARPQNLASAMRIEGMSPAAGLVLLAATRSSAPIDG